MLTAPPRERPLLSWVYVFLCAILIYLTIPFARAVVGFIDESIGRWLFSLIIYSAIILCVLGITLYLRRTPPEKKSAYVWLLAVAAGFAGYSWHLRSIPEEALHFIQYGALGVLLYRALSHHFRDFSVFIIAVFVGALFGAIDETIQWLTPGRVWDIRDIIINFSAVTFIQIAIAMGLRPPLIKRGLPKESLFAVSVSALACTAYICACLLNTPTVIKSYVDIVPGISQLKSKTSLMAEYGFLYQDPEIGIFRSRLTRGELAEADRTVGKAAGEKIAASKGRAAFAKFIRTYTPLNAPFLHEVRVHMRSRDVHWRIGQEIKQTDFDQHRIHMTHAYREQLILERYFPETLKASGFSLSHSQRDELAKLQLPDYDYESPVSRNLITTISETEMRWLTVLLLAILTAATFFAAPLRGKRGRANAGSRK